jgi:glycosyltransferase involved in cell wall biosynthesis
MVMQWAEDFAYKHVDKVMSLLWNAEEHMRERGLQADKFVCIPNGYSLEEWTADKVDLPLPAEHQHYFDLHKDEIIVGFAGGFAASGAVTTLVKAAVELKDRIGLFFVLVGKGPEQAQYEQIVKEHHLTNVSFLPSVPKKLIPAIIKHFDIAYLGGVHSELHKYGTSYNKMTDYMLSGKPIIQAVDEPGSVVERIKCGVRVEAENVKEVVRAIESLSGLSLEEREKMGLRGKEYVEKNLPWSKLAEDFLKPFV